MSRWVFMLAALAPTVALAQGVAAAPSVESVVNAAAAGQWGAAAGGAMLLLVSGAKRAGIIKEVANKILRTLMMILFAQVSGMGAALVGGLDWRTSAFAGLGAVLSGPLLWKALPKAIKSKFDGKVRE